MVVRFNQIWCNLNTWFWNQTSSQEVATEKSESTIHAPVLTEETTAWTRKSQLWKFAQTMSSKDLEIRESGSLELKQLTTKLIREQWLLVTTTTADQWATWTSRTGPSVTQTTWDLTQLGRMTGMTQLNIPTHTDMIMSISQNKNTKMFSEVPWELPFKKKPTTIKSTSSRASQLPWLSTKLSSARIQSDWPSRKLMTSTKNEEAVPSDRMK